MEQQGLLLDLFEFDRKGTENSSCKESTEQYAPELLDSSCTKEIEQERALQAQKLASQVQAQSQKRRGRKPIKDKASVSAASAPDASVPDASVPDASANNRGILAENGCHARVLQIQSSALKGAALISESDSASLSFASQKQDPKVEAKSQLPPPKEAGA